MPDFLVIVRWLHVLAAASWFGEVVTINFVLVPALGRMAPETRGAFLGRVFPRIFRLASTLSATAVLTGLIMFYARYAGQWELAWTTPTGRSLSLGALMGMALTSFHFFMEPRLGDMVCVAEEKPLSDVPATVLHLLRVVPRVGLLVIGSIVLLMMMGARGW